LSSGTAEKERSLVMFNNIFKNEFLEYTKMEKEKERIGWILYYNLKQDKNCYVQFINKKKKL
ncbi:MAG: hypothetical protein ACO259_03215, partial [Bacteroidia bacterium]